jgi:glycine oxidase
MYRAGLEWILGFRLRGTTLLLDPCLPRAWRGFEIAFRYHSARYDIAVENPRGVTRGVTGVELDGGTRPAAHVVLACGSWSALVDGVGLPARAVAPVRGQMIELETRPTPLRHVIFGDGGYLVPRRDGRVLCGSTEEHTWDKQVTPAGLERLVGRVRRLCPALAEAPIARSWSGLRPGTPDGLPILGPSPLAGLHLATGHYRNGILLLPITTEVVVASVTGAAPPVPLAPFSPARFG